MVIQYKIYSILFNLIFIFNLIKLLLITIKFNYDK